MDEFKIISVLPGLLLVVFVILAQSYWTEAREFYHRARNTLDTSINRLEYVENYRRALGMLRTISCGMIVCLLSAIVPVFISGFISILFVKCALALVSLFLIAFLGIMISGTFVIRYSKPSELLKRIQSKNKNDLA